MPSSTIRKALTLLGLATLILSTPGPVRPLRAGDAVAAEAPASEGHLLVLNKGENTLMIFDVPSHRLLSKVAVGEEPHEVVPAPDGRKAYVSNVRGRSVSVVDLERYRVLKTITSENLEYPHGMAVTPDGRWLLLTSEGSRRLVLIDARRDVIARTLTVSQKGSHMVALVDQGKRAFVTNRESDSVSLVGLPDLKVRRTIRLGPGPEGIAAAPNGRLVVIALQGSGQVALLDSASQEILARLPAGQTPIRVAFAPRSFTAFVSNRGSDDVTVLDLLSRRVKATVRVGRRPGGIVTNAAGTRAYVCNNDSASVSVITVPGFEVKEEIKAGAGPDGVAFVPARPGAGRGSRRPGA